MAKNDNITDLLTDIASAIREKKGTTDLINPQNFGEEIKSIKSGGAWVEPEESMVNFYDYDGTLLYAYTWDEASQLTEMPTPPYEHDGLVFAGWNYTLEDLKRQGDYADIGAMYTTDNGRHRLRIVTTGVPVRMGISGTATVYWGDGMQEEASLDMVHDYGDYLKTYVIEIEGTTKIVISSLLGCDNVHVFSGSAQFGLGQMMGSGLETIATNNNFSADERWLYAVYVPYVTIPKPQAANHTFISFHSSKVKHVSIPPTQSMCPETMFYGNAVISKLIFPADAFLNTSSSNLGQNFIRREELRRIVVSKNNENYSSENANVLFDKSNGTLIVGCQHSHIPKGTKIIGLYAFHQCNKLKTLELPEGLQRIESGAFHACQGITEAFFPDSLEFIGNGAYNNTGLKRVTFGANLDKLDAMALVYSYKMEVIDCRRCTKVPTMANNNALSGLPTTTKIVIPDALFDTWSTATNWATYSNRMIKASEYVES